MLQSIRDRTQGWIAGIIMSLLILSFALWGIHSWVMGGGVTNTVAEVNGTDITKQQLMSAYERLRRQLQNDSLIANTETSLKERALKSLIDIQVLKQASVKQGYRISDQQLDNVLENMPEFQINGQFSLARFQQILNAALLSSAEFLESIKTTLLIDQPRMGMIFSSFALPNEVSDSMALVEQQRDIQYVILPFHDVASQSILISQKQIEDYYDKHKDEFKTPEQVSLNYVELSLSDMMQQIHPTEEDLMKFYNENANSFVEPAKWKLETLILPIAENAKPEELKLAEIKINDVYHKTATEPNFDILARQYGLSKGDGLLKDWVTINQLETELQKPVLTMVTPGQITKPIKTKKGFVIVKILNYANIQTLSYAQAKPKVKDLYLRQKAEEQFLEQKEKLANLTYEHPDSLNPAAAEMKLPLYSTVLFTQESGGKDISSNKQIREIAFTHDVINLQNNSDVIQVSPEKAVVIRIKTHQPAALLSLAEVQQKIINKLKEKEIMNKTLERANILQQQLQRSNNPDQIGKLDWNKIGYVSRHSPKIDSAILDTAFSMPKPLNKKLTYGVAKVANGYAILGLKDIKNGIVQNSDQYRVFSEQIQNSQGLLEYELYKQSLMEKAKIVIS